MCICENGYLFLYTSISYAARLWIRTPLKTGEMPDIPYYRIAVLFDIDIHHIPQSQRVSTENETHNSFHESDSAMLTMSAMSTMALLCQ